MAIRPPARVVIIGAGIGGLATAALLAKAGYAVSVYEQASAPGGRAGQHRAEGFLFDTGPSWYLMPEVFEQFFTLMGENIIDHLTLERLSPAYKVFFESGQPSVTIHADLARDCKTFEAIEPGAGAALRAYVASAGKTYDLALKHFLYTTYTSPRDFMKMSMLPHLPTLLRRATQPIHSHVARYFTDQRLQQIMEYPMVFLGTSPYQASSIYSLMSHMDFTQGVYYPKGGVYEIIAALYNLCRKHGVDFYLNHPVAAIRTEGKRAAGVTTADGTGIAADIVISNADMHFTETQLLPRQLQSYPETYWRKKQSAPSALLMYLGIDGKLPELTHHNLIFTKNWRQNFDDIFKRQVLPKPASMYICKPSETDPNVAPKGTENVFVLVPLPAKLDGTAPNMERHAEEYIAQLTHAIGVPDFKERIRYKRLFGPHDFKDTFNAWNGTALGLSHVLSQSALLRPSNKSKKVANLYYVGANTMPGIGLPMCLISAQLVYKRLAGLTGGGPLLNIGDTL